MSLRESWNNITTLHSIRGSRTRGQPFPELIALPTLATAASGEFSQHPTESKTNNPTQTQELAQDKFQVKDSVPDLRATSTSKVTITKTLVPRPVEELTATMDQLSKAKMQDCDKSKREVITVMQDRIKTKGREKKNMDLCPGASICMRASCTHKNQYVICYLLLYLHTPTSRWRRKRPIREAIANTVCREYGEDQMVGAVVSACKDCGYHITEGYAAHWLQKYPGNPNYAAIGARLDIDARECFMIRVRNTRKLS